MSKIDISELRIEPGNESGTAEVYNKIVEAAVDIMGSQFATLQMLVPDNGTNEKLRMVASFGFSPEAQKFWEFIYHHTGSSCGEVLRTRRRVIVPDYRTCDFMKGTPTLKVFLEGGILSAQSTPLFTKAGKLIGMISTHWNAPHTPATQDLKILDVLARQAADIMERAISDNGEK